MVEATIKGDALFHQDFETGGLVDFRLAKVGQSLSFNHARFIGKNANGLNAERATVGGALYWVDIALTPHTMLDLSGVHAGAPVGRRGELARAGQSRSRLASSTRISAVVRPTLIRDSNGYIARRDRIGRSRNRIANWRRYCAKTVRRRARPRSRSHTKMR